MSILTNPRHEKFANLLAQGQSAYQSYIDAGFRPSRANASRLKANDDIMRRVFEIQQAGAKSAEITVASLLDELEHARQRADSLGQLSASVRAISEKARLAGLVVDRQQVEVTAVNPYEEMNTAQEVLARVTEELGEKVARALAEAFEVEFDPNWRPTPNQAEAPIQAVEWTPPRKSKREI